MLVTAVSYAVITIDELLEQHDHIEEQILFSIAIVLYIGIAYWIVKSTSIKPLIILIAGNVSLVVLYFIAESSLSESLLGMETEELSDFGITVKIFQIAIIVLSIIQIKTLIHLLKKPVNVTKDEQTE